MKKIEAIVRPFKLEAIREALSELGIEEMTAIEAKAFGRQSRHAGIFRGGEYAVDFIPKVKLELVVNDLQVDPAISAIMESGKLGDEEVFVSTVAPARTPADTRQAVS
jgi:nitrogen regulatory protein P-II 1